MQSAKILYNLQSEGNQILFTIFLNKNIKNKTEKNNSDLINKRLFTTLKTILFQNI